MEIEVKQGLDRIIYLHKKPYLYFGGTSYLGVTTTKKFQKILLKSMQKWGTTYGSSRKSNVTLNVYEKGEANLSKFIKSEAVLTTSSGTLSAHLAREYLASKKHHFFHLNSNLHPAVKVKKSRPVFVNDSLNPALKNNTSEHITILTESIPSLTINLPSFEFLNQISKEKKITLLIDESHSLGICGEKGNGFFETISTKTNVNVIMVASLNKAFGVSGGLIASSVNTIKEIKESSAFTGASPMNPIFLETYRKASKIYRKKRGLLFEKLQFLEEKLKPNSLIIFDKAYPVIYFLEDNISDYLIEKNIIITSFKYPTSPKKLNRIVITANHTYDDLIRLSDALNSFNLSSVFKTN